MDSEGNKPQKEDIAGQARGIFSSLSHCWQQNPVKFALWSGLSFFVTIVLMSVILEYSYRPQSCIFCHEMKPAHETWKESFHGPLKGGANDCLGCHAAPGFGSKIKAKLGGLIFLWEHAIGNLEADIKAEKPVYCVRSGCHTDPWDMDRGSKVRVNHALHISKGYACVVCHDRIAHGSDPQGLNLPGMKDFCFPCHNDEIASRSKCEYCHIYQEAMLLGSGGEGIPEGDTSAHTTINLLCIDCHTEGCLPRPVQTCLECHAESYTTEYEAQRIWVSQFMDALEDGIPILDKAIKEYESMGSNITQLNGIYNLIQAVYAFIKADGSDGAHNVAYSRALLKNALNRLNYAYLLINQKNNKIF